MRLCLLVAAVLLAGCSIRPQVKPVPEPDLLRARVGQTACAVASLLVKITPKEGDGELFTLRLWATPDGRVRVLAHKLDVDFLSALVEADGSYAALLPRAKVWTRGKLGGADDPVLLRDLALLVAEVRSGPLPPGAVVAVAADAWRYRDPASGWNAEVVRGADGLPSSKRLLTADGVEQRRLGYAQWKSYDGLQRPEQVTLAVAGDSAAYSIRLKSLDAPPMISDERMSLRIPEGTQQLPAAEFAQRIGE